MAEKRTVYGIWDGSGWLCGQNNIPFHADAAEVMAALIENLFGKRPALIGEQWTVQPIGLDGKPADALDEVIDWRRRAEALEAELAACKRIAQEAAQEAANRAVEAFLNAPAELNERAAQAEASLQDYKRGNQDLMEEAEEQTKKINAQVARIQELEADKKRLDWMDKYRGAYGYVVHRSGRDGDCIGLIVSIDLTSHSEYDIRQAIDADIRALMPERAACDAP